MYRSLITGIGNCLRNHWGEYTNTPIEIRYSGNDSYWNRAEGQRLTLPGIAYSCSTIQFPKGFSNHNSINYLNSNLSETIGKKLIYVPMQVDFSLNMLAKDIEEHLWHIHKYVEFATLNAQLEYPVTVLDTGSAEAQETWRATLNNFSELTPPATGREFSNYEPEGLMYSLEATFSVHSAFIFTEEHKLIRVVTTNRINESHLDINVTNR